MPASIWRRRCTRPASCRRRTARPTSTPHWPPPATPCVEPLRPWRPEPYAPAHPRHLRHLHGRPGGAGVRGRPPRDRLRCQRLPADEHAAAGAGHRADRGLRRRAAGAAARCLRHRQRRHARRALPADGGHPRRRPALCLGPAVAGRACAAGPPCTGGGRHPRQDDDDVHAGVDPGACGPEARFPGGRRAAELRRVRAAGRKAGRRRAVPRRDSPRGGQRGSRRATHGGLKSLRHRSRRVRHRLLRQAQQVRPLPAPDGRAQQPGARPRRHLPRPRRHRDPVPPPRAHRAGQRPAGRQCPRRRAATRAGAWLLERGATLRREEGRGGHAAGPRRAPGLRRAARQPEAGAGGVGADRRAQPAQRAGGHRRGRACGRHARAGRGGLGRVPERASPHGTARRGGWRQGVRRLRPPSDGHAHHHQRPAPPHCAGRTHPGHLRAALQHDEAGHDEGPVALGAGGS
mmetsp:Transcript_9625/g.22385  ORF Transcript_9625/g.22385 Transcript_9625/m.22385 type:complete len:460 (-) Transcript_9625:213-1592(-)